MDAEYRGTVALRVKQACLKHGLAERATDAILTRDAGEQRFLPQLPADDQPDADAAMNAVNTVGKKRPHRALPAWEGSAQGALFG